MDEALRFFRFYEGWIYFFLGLGALIYVRRFYTAWQEMRSTIFGLERESAQYRLSQASTILVLMILITIGEFVIVSYIVPLRPQAVPQLTPTIDLLATATTTLPPQATTSAEEFATPGEPTPTVDGRVGDCVAGVAEITSPEPGDQLRGEVVVEGSAWIFNLGFYKLEVSLQTAVNWTTLQARREAIQNGVLLPVWDTSTLAPGNYFLRLVVEDNAGFALPDCRVPVTILAP